jgi:hypothetical protein
MLRTLNHRSLSRQYVGLILALVGLIGTAALVLGSAGVASAQAIAASWSFTGALSTARQGHTVTRLQNGKVLAAGGYSNGSRLNSAELYDPATGTWSSTGNLNSFRFNHAATLLPNGNVLVVGGDDNLKTAELYNPATGTWSFTGNAVNYVQIAILLTSGKVLGIGSDPPALYDPGSGTWAPTGNFEFPFGFSATLLSNGKVLIAGGDSGDGDFAVPVNSAELYDPTTETWSSTGDLNSGREFHTATLLPNGKVLVAGGYDSNSLSNSAELYEPATGKWSITGSLNTEHVSHAATLLLNGKVLVVGGNDSGNAEVYDPATGIWSLTASLNEPRRSPVTLLSNGKVLIAAGDTGSGDLNSAELYEPGANAPASPIDDAQFFVTQQYHDFLNREPDPDGLAFWTKEIASCGNDQQCVDAKRVNVSAAFYLSIEFQQTGYLVYRMYKAAYGNMSGGPVPIKFDEFLPDTRAIGQGVIVNQPGWEQLLENNKQVFTSDFAQRTRFTDAFPMLMSTADFVDKLNANADSPLSQSERDELVNSGMTRAQILRAVAEDPDLKKAEFDRAFVLTQYFGYLRRNPPDAPEPTRDFQGYSFWLSKLDQFNGDFANADMVKAFIVSGEYRQRFTQ